MSPYARLLFATLLGTGLLHSLLAHAGSETETETEAEGLSRRAPRFQLGLSLNLLSYQRADFNVEPVNSGRSFEGTLIRKSYGPSGSAVTLEPGIVFFNGRLVLGLLLDIGSNELELAVPGLSFELYTTSGSFAVGPRALYFFTEGGTLRPYGLIAFGYTTTPSNQSAQTIRITEYQGFAGFGAHYFLDPAFSLDMSVRGAYGKGSGYVDSPPLENASLDGTVFTLMWNFGTSGWLG